MPHDRFYTPFDIEKEVPLEISGDEFHHLSRVMRKKEGATLELVNGRGILAEAKILKLEKRSASLLPEKVSSFPEPDVQITLIQAIPKMPKLELIIEKCTELGVSTFWLFPGERSEKEALSKNQMTRLEIFMISALKQSGRLHLPQLLIKPSLDKLDLPEGKVYFGDPRTENRSMEFESQVSFVNGPEKGFSPKEEKMLKEKGAHPVRINPWILRTESAAIASSALLAYKTALS